MTAFSVEMAALRLFEKALDVPEARRAAWLEAFEAPPDVKARAAALLEADRLAADAFLTGGAAQAADVENPPERIGNYRIVGLIGRGGMGTVYLGARAAGDFDHRAAIKVVRPGPLAEALIERFDRERRILARLDHPNIARLLDGGATPDGSPYFVMEYVDGRPLQALCSAKTPLAQRLDAFRQVCRAVAYAHQNLIVHGDVTPANILVRDDGQAKLVDFGIAHLVSAGLVAPPPQPARDGAYTHAYAAPERLAGEPASTLTDIYSLGAILRDLLKAGGADAELKAIAAKAGAADRSQRYGSVEGLIADLERHAEGFPVEAMEGGRLYHLTKLVGRHRLAFAAAAAGVLGLTVALGVVAGLYRQAESARAAEAQRFSEVRTLASFMLFDLNDQLARTPGNTLARVELAAQAQKYLSGLARSTDAPADLRLDTARGLVRLAQIQGVPPEPNLGEGAKAKANLATAEAMLERLAKEGYANDKVAPERARTAAFAALLAAHGDTDLPAARRLTATAQAHLDSVPTSARSADWRDARRRLRRAQAEVADLSDDMNELAARAAQLEADIAEWPPAMRGGRDAAEDLAFARHYQGLSQRYDKAKAHGLAPLREAGTRLEALTRQHPDDPRLLYLKAYNDFAAFNAAANAGEDAASSAYIANARQTAARLLAIEANDRVLATFADQVEEAYAQDLSNRGRHAEAIAAQRRLVALAKARVTPERRANAVSQVAWTQMILGLIGRKASDRALTCEAWREAEAGFAALEKRGEIMGFHAGFLPGLRANLTHCAAGRPLSAFGPLRS